MSVALFGLMVLSLAVGAEVGDSSPLCEKAVWFERDLIDRHLIDGLFVSIVPVLPKGVVHKHDVNEQGNVIHAGVWTGRYLAGVGYQYAVTHDPKVRQLGGDLLVGLRRLQEITGKSGLLARGYVRGHGPVEGYEREGRDSIEWHQGQGKFADYRWYGDVSVDNFNAVLYGYAIYFDLAADNEQKKFIAHDTDRLMTHLLENHCRIVDVDGDVTQWGHVGFDPDPAREADYKKSHPFFKRFGMSLTKLPLQASLMLLPDLLIAHHITGKQVYRDFCDRVVAFYQANPEIRRRREPTPEVLARIDHSSEGQSFEALYNLIRYETNPQLLPKYRQWTADLWNMNWMEGNPLFAYMTMRILPDFKSPIEANAIASKAPSMIPHGDESVRLAMDTLKKFPIDRVFRPVMNSIRPEIEKNPHSRNEGRSTKPLPINVRPHDNEYEWKGNPYQLDGWLKPTVTAWAFAADDPKVAWFCDSAGHAYMTLDWPNDFRDVTVGTMGAAIRNLVASPKRTFVLHAQTDRGVLVSRDGGMSWRTAAATDSPKFDTPTFNQWKQLAKDAALRVNEKSELVRSADGGKTTTLAMSGWRIPRCTSVFVTPKGVIASGPGGCYQSTDGEHWTELKLWTEYEVGAADFLHAYWMGRYYGFIAAKE